ncbi:MAG TPA: glycosyltransferase 87 family protein [Micromonosporaceae bacterium]
MPIGAASPPQADPDRRPAAATWRQVGLLALVTAVAVGGFAWYGLRHNFFDLKIYHSAMRWWASGHPLYEFWQPDDTQGRLEFTYPPFAALLLRPLGSLTVGQAVASYVVVSIGLLALSLWWLARPLADRYGWPRWLTFGLALVLATGLEPIREAFMLGQINVILWTLILLDLLILLPRRSRLVGVGIGLATAIKLVPGIFIVYLLVARRWRAALVAAGTAVAATLLAAAISPSASWQFWTDRLRHGEGVGQLGYEFNQSILGMLARITEPDQPDRAVWLVLVVPVLGYGMWRAARAAGAGDEVAGIALTGIVGSLISPVTWVHHVFWLVPALMVLVGAAARPADVVAGVRRPATALGVAITGYATVTVSLISLWAFQLGRPGGALGFVLTNWLVWVMIILLATLPVRRGEVAPVQPDQEPVARTAH